MWHCIGTLSSKESHWVNMEERKKEVKWMLKLMGESLMKDKLFPYPQTIYP